jgi:hypothetical protein
MDESGFQPSNQGRRRVVAQCGKKNAYKQGGAGRKNVTVLVTICANGTVLKPSVIFKGARMPQDWSNQNVAGCLYVVHGLVIIAHAHDFASVLKSPNRWTDQQITVEWLTKTFDPQTKEKAAGCKRVLLVDGHNLHTSAEFLREADARNFIVLAYPPHCTHALQGLDVVCFAKMKKVWHDEITEFEKLGRKVNKTTFLFVFGTAFLKAFDEGTVKAAFSATGIVPYNPNIITAEQMKPSKPYSTHGTFPLA